MQNMPGPSYWQHLLIITKFRKSKLKSGLLLGTFSLAKRQNKSTVRLLPIPPYVLRFVGARSSVSNRYWERKEVAVVIGELSTHCLESRVTVCQSGVMCDCVSVWAAGVAAELSLLYWDSGGPTRLLYANCGKHACCRSCCQVSSLLCYLEM